MPRRLGVVVAIVTFVMSASSANAIVVPINVPSGFSPFGALHDLAARIIEDTEHIVASIERAAGNLIPGPSPSYTAAAAAASVSEPTVAPSPPANNPPLTPSTTTITAAEQPIVAAAIIPSTQSTGNVLSARLASLTGIVGSVLALLPSLENQEPQSNDVSVQTQIDALSHEIAQTNQIGALSNVTIENPTVQGGISGLTAEDIPTLDYLSLAGGSLAGDLSISGNATTSGAAYVAGNLGIGTSTTQDALALNGSAYLASITVPLNTTNRLYANSGNLYWSGNLLGGASTGNWTSDGTNVWRSGGAVGIGTSSPFATLAVVGNGYFTGGLTAANASTTNLSVSGNSTLGNATSTSLFSPVADFTNGIISTLNASVANIVGFTATNATTTNLAVTSLPSTLLSTNANGSVQSTTISAPLSLSGTTLSIAQANGSSNGFLNSSDWTNFNGKLASTSLSGTEPITYNSATGAIGFDFTHENTWTGTQTFGNITATNATTTNATTTDLALSSQLTELNGTSQEIFANYPGSLWELSQGTVASPITAADPTFKISRTENIASTTCTGTGAANSVDNECNSALSVYTYALPSSSMQPNAIFAGAEGAPTGAGLAVVGLTALGRVINSSSAYGVGAYIEGRRDTSTGGAQGTEIRVENVTNTPGTYNPNGVSQVMDAWFTTSAGSTPEPAGAGIGFGGIGGSQFMTGIGFTSGSIASSSIEDNSQSQTSLNIQGNHTYGLVIARMRGASASARSLLDTCSTRKAGRHQSRPASRVSGRTAEEST
jgi:hypothetical protein